MIFLQFILMMSMIVNNRDIVLYCIECEHYLNRNTRPTYKAYLQGLPTRPAYNQEVVG